MIQHKLGIIMMSLFISIHGAAHAWPDKPVRIVVPYPPGGNVDTAARMIAPDLQAIFGQPFVVENKPGAGGLIAGEFVAKSPPDGYTLFMAANGPLLFSPTIFNRHVFNWKKDFIPISTISFTPLVLQVKPSLPVNNLQELIDYAKKNPGKLNMASPGAGTSNHLVSELIQEKTGAKWTTVHYKGNAPATADLLGGQVDFNFDQISVSLPFITNGRVKGIAVSSDKRLASLSNVPTFAESGLVGAEAVTFTGLLAPTGTPEAIILRLSEAIKKVVSNPVIIKRFDVMGAEAKFMTPKEFGTYLTNEDAKWLPIIKQANIKAN
jgi:tripartite-type tricarboxylate transporter receptor subunit TctC